MMRLDSVAGEWIDRSRSVDFSFEGCRYSGFEGDTISSALWAAGARMLGRSFKYHRPRGVLSLANHDVNVLVQDGRSLNVRADVTPLTQDLQLTAVNTFGSLQNDRAHVLDRLSAFLPVGFYYKTFFRPKWAFPRWEKLIRRMSGLGTPDFKANRVRSSKRYDFCDVLVVGAGPSGMSAALTAARHGANVVLVDENARIGGSLTYARGGDQRSLALLGDYSGQLQRNPNVRVWTSTSASGYYDDRSVALISPVRMIEVNARSVIVAAGAFEQPAIFRHNDLPGVMLASAAQRLIYRYAVRPMQRALVVTANAEGYAAALDLLGAGVEIPAIVDLRDIADASASAQRIGTRRVPVVQGSCIYQAIPSARGTAVKGATVCSIRRDGGVDLSTRKDYACDGIVMSVGFAPANALLHQAGATMRFDDFIQQFVPQHLPVAVFAAGRVNGAYQLDERLKDGERAALQALHHLGLISEQPHGDAPAPLHCPTHRYPIVEHPQGKNFVDFDEDLQVKDFAHAVQEGFDSVELIKRYTTVGMGPSQGKHSNMNAVRILARLTREPVANVGTATARPFFHPVPLGHLAGRGFTPQRRTPLHARHHTAGAVFMQAGAWLRPEYYARQRKRKDELVMEEALTVRQNVGLIDVGTLGKIEVSGPDAAELLERCYTGRFSNLKVGMTRYAVMLDEAGIVIDDGVVARLDQQRYYFTTTTTGSTTVYRELQRLIIQWRLDCGIVNLTGALAAMNVAGPRSRDLLQRLTDMPLADVAFPYLGVREGAVAGVVARIMRVGFVGELGFELHVSADNAAYLWDALVKTGDDLGLRLFGVEAQRLLRLEKGHLIVGQDTDGLTTPFEASLDWAVKMDKPFFVGQRSLKAISRRTPRTKLVGFTLPRSFRDAMPKECHLVVCGGEIAGRVTSVAFSPALQRIVGLAMVPPDSAVPGKVFEIKTDHGQMTRAEVAALPFYDPDGSRQKPSAAAAAAREASRA